MKHNETKREKEEFEWTKEDFMEEFQKPDKKLTLKKARKVLPVVEEN